MIASVKQPPELKNSKLSSLQKKLPKLKLGRAGEKLAATFLSQKNFTILEQNLCWQQLEVDLIARDSSTGELVFVEVKTRSNGKVPAHLAINRQKINALRRFAAIYIAKKFPRQAYRIDAICITGQTIDHFQNITWFS